MTKPVRLIRSALFRLWSVDKPLTGVGLLMPAIRLKEKYLAGQDRVLNIEIDLPDGKVQLLVGLPIAGCALCENRAHCLEETHIVPDAQRLGPPAFLPRRHLPLSG